MHCYFRRDGLVVGVEELTDWSSLSEAVERAFVLYAQRAGNADCYEIWERSRLILQIPVAARSATFVDMISGPRSPRAQEIGPPDSRRFACALPTSRRGQGARF